MGRSGVLLTKVDSSADRLRSDLCNSAERSEAVISGTVEAFRKLLRNRLRRVRRPYNVSLCF